MKWFNCVIAPLRETPNPKANKSNQIIQNQRKNNKTQKIRYTFMNKQFKANTNISGDKPMREQRIFEIYID